MLNEIKDANAPLCVQMRQNPSATRCIRTFCESKVKLGMALHLGVYFLAEAVYFSYCVQFGGGVVLQLSVV